MTARISKKTATQVSKLINSLLVHQCMIDRRMTDGRTQEACEIMSLFNRDADKLVEMGIPVTKYGI
jgi:hypothetical protein